MMKGFWNDTTYYCDKCNTNRKLKIKNQSHDDLLRASKSGLVYYSDIHTCQKGILSVNNLQIDNDFNVRTIESLVLPKYEKPKLTGIPNPSATPKDESKLIFLTEIPAKADKINLVIDYKMIQTKIKIGRFNTADKPIKTYNSQMDGVTLYYYKSETQLSDYLDQWLQYFTSAIEIIFPTSLGMFIEAIVFVLDLHNQPLTDFDKTFLKTILASHEIFFQIQNIENLMDLHQKYTETFSDEDFSFIEQFLALLDDNQEVPIQDFTNKTEKGLIYQLYLFLILEKENIISIQRPGIVEFD